MWPFERRSDVLRVGRHSVELWARTGGELALAGHEALGQPELAELQRAAAQLLSRSQTRAALDVVIESAWLPVVPIEPGPTLLARAAVEALARHRLTTLYGAADASSMSWDLIVDHRPGNRWGLGYGLLPSVRAALLHAAAQARRQVVSMQPALCWAHVRFDRRLPKRAWWLWAEQDRSLVAFIDQGSILALNAGAPAVRDAASVKRLVEVERVRQGIEGDAGTVVVASWNRVPVGGADSSHCSWLSVSPALPSASAATHSALGTQGAT